MCLTPVMLCPEGVRPFGLRGLEFGRFQSVARSGQKSLAQGLPWVSRKYMFRPEGARNAHAIRFKGPEPIIAASRGPFSFRANSGGGTTQGKPWATLFRPLRATGWPYDPC